MLLHWKTVIWKMRHIENHKFSVPLLWYCSKGKAWILKIICKCTGHIKGFSHAGHWVLWDFISCLHLLWTLTSKSTFVHSVWLLQLLFQNYFYLPSAKGHSGFLLFWLGKLPLKDKTEAQFQLCCTFQKWHLERTFSPPSTTNSRFFCGLLHLTVMWAQLDCWQDKVSDKTGKSENQVFLYRASLRSVEHQHFRFLIKDGNNEAADKMETAYELSIVLHCFT